ncbi:MAG TPA: NAD(P)-dependent alcohol dehydrogenase [Caulobacteraceae bacterium]|jgi:NADPH:quinone reductase-like Zn-dependent oxidoreductase|nr:NAD(P)-dependent alcohol dehydrogenase [Caulobacteraceae bacterium]
MRAMVLDGGAGLENLKPAARDWPTPKPGEVVVRLAGASINYRDLATVTMMAPQRPLIPLSDGAGVVEAVGDGVTRVKVGDLVMPSFFPHWVAGRPTPQRLAALGGALDGVACEAIALTAEGVTKAPAGWDAAEAATLPCAAVTAWRGLMVEGKLMAGETVLVQGTGGVSIFALQFAKLAGARVIVTSSSDEKLERAKAMGADATINYRETPDWATAARQLTGGRGVDHVVEVGGAGTFQQSITACALGGSIAVIGVLSGFVKDLNVAAMFGGNLHINGITVGSREHVEQMVSAIEVAKLKPVIDRRFQLEQLPEALALMQSGGHFGKVVIDIA